MLPAHSYSGHPPSKPMRTFYVAVHEEHWRSRWLRRRKVGWWAESDDAPGWFAAASTKDELLHLVLPGLRFHTGEKGWLQAIYTYLPRAFCPDCAGRRAVEKHGDALRRLGE